MRHVLRPSLVFLVVFTVLTGLIYPLAITGIGQSLFRTAADGSPVMRDGRVVGSALIGQAFTSDDYFWGRPSAAGDGYNARASGGSNLGPSSQALADRVRQAAERYGRPAAEVPVELLTASASGLDPHISPVAARFQAPRVAQARALPEARVLALIDASTEAPIGGIVGEARVNVLRLNMALDELAPRRNGAT